MSSVVCDFDNRSELAVSEMRPNNTLYYIQMWCTFIILVLIKCLSVNGQKEIIGEKLLDDLVHQGFGCKLWNGTPGSCKLIDDCPDVLRDQCSKRPLLCGYSIPDLIVCCPKVQGNETLQIDKGVEVGKKAKEKCLEYSKYVYEWVLPENETDPEKKIRVNNCGHIASAFVIGHDVTAIREYPHMALLGRKNPDETNDWICGGTLISENFVLTAAMCTYPRYGELRWVRLGEHSLDIAHESEIQDFGIEEIIRHPDFKFPVKYNNIALVRLDRKAILNKFVIPACLHTEFDIEHKTATTTGWGSPSKGEELRLDLSKVVLQIFTQEECNATYASGIDETLEFGIDESMLCAGNHTLNRGPCNRDGGGPLQVYLKEPYCMYDVIGVTSLGVGCETSKYPEIYNRVSHYIEWIESVAWPN